MQATVFILLHLINILRAQENVALEQVTNQQEDLFFQDFFWTSNKAVDGCVQRDVPDTQQCCSCSLGEADNFWRVNLSQPVVVESIRVLGRADGQGEDQLGGFTVFIAPNTPDDFEQQVYTNAGVEFGDGDFMITLGGTLVSSVIIKRPNILTLCEVEVYAATTSSTSPSTPSTPVTSTTLSTTILTTATIPTTVTTSTVVTSTATSTTSMPSAATTTAASPEASATTETTATTEIAAVVTTAGYNTTDMGNGGNRRFMQISSIFVILFMVKLVAGMFVHS